jgi:hypothetical protein
VDFDSADLIESFATGTYTVTRRAAAAFVIGRAGTPGTSTLAIRASVYPATGRDLQRLPEGRRSLETRTLHTTTQLLVATEGGNNCDLVTIDGQQWEVQMCETWPSAPNLAFKAIVQRAAV